MPAIEGTDGQGATEHERQHPGESGQWNLREIPQDHKVGGQDDEAEELFGLVVGQVGERVRIVRQSVHKTARGNREQGVEGGGLDADQGERPEEDESMLADGAEST